MEVDDDLIDDFVGHIKESAEEIGRQLTDPGDDWMACWFALAEAVPQQDDDSEGGFICVGVDSAALRDNASKDKMCEAIPQMMVQAKSRVAAFLSSTFYVMPEDDWPQEMKELIGQVTPSEHPWRKEGLHVMVVPEGDRPIQVWAAEIHRDERDVPYLQEWTRFPGGDGDGPQFQGRFYEALCKAVQREP